MDDIYNVFHMSLMDCLCTAKTRSLSFQKKKQHSEHMVCGRSCDVCVLFFLLNFKWQVATDNIQIFYILKTCSLNYYNKLINKMLSNKWNSFFSFSVIHIYFSDFIHVKWCIYAKCEFKNHNIFYFKKWSYLYTK